MRVTGFSAILAGLTATALLAILALPVHAAGGGSGGGHGAAAAPPPVVAVMSQPPKPIALLDVPADELSPTLRPAEAPPPDFTAAQFIDSAGCVFVRVPEGWRARIARDASAICGYPPTFSARRTGPDLVTPLFPDAEEPRAARLERVLSEKILGNLQDGELAAPAAAGRGKKLADAGQAAAGQGGQSAAAPGNLTPDGVAPQLGGVAEARTDAAHDAPASKTGSADPLGVGAAMAAGPALQRQMAGRAADRDHFCGLLGAAPAGEGRGSMALGLCGAAAPLPGAQPRVVASADAASTDRKTAAAPKKTVGIAKAAPASLAKADTDAAKPYTAGRKNARASGASKKKPGDNVAAQMMIPPGARYIQIGAFRDAVNADRAARRLGAMGFPVVRAGGHPGDPMQIIMVGPLDGREAMVRAIDRVRRAGYRDAYPRR